jgi:ABC-type multidrug transport system fused ATPase/permease subunit
MTDANKDTKKIEDDEVMITSSISDLEKMLEGVEKNTNTKFERFFLPALAVFSATIIGMFVIIYSITTDMTRLANAMDPNMGTNMTSMVKSVEKLSNNITKMTNSVAYMQKNFDQVNKNMTVIATKLDNLDVMSADLTHVSAKMDALEPMLINMEEMNKNMTTMQDSMTWMQRDLSILRASFSRPMSVINKMPFPF